MSFPTQQENPNGLHLRYIVSKVNGEPVDKDADYLVFRIDDGGSDATHIHAGRVAGLAYASAIQHHLPQVAADVRARCSSAYIHTEASTEEALLILDDAQANAATLSDLELLRAIDMAAQKLRPVPTPDHDAEALEQLAKEHPIDLPWMQPVVAVGIPSDGGRANCLNSDCAGCKPGMIAVRSYEFEGGILHLELAAVRNMSTSEIVEMYGFGKGRLLDVREGQMPVKQFYALGEFLDL
ncbi:hypothetical protein DNI29_19075 [Hymenobacter sediminis]|uniref:hypothetical protein n=1 Tax=Hymenobacter sediminis TaxID=2218621 RepID=UPI000DA6A2CF|nr:hypothetical protein [Hymenobacter sediminis]RPD45485.1 hypothetical protein DNI29_19075 [Hymenobacter sediminis]